MKEFAKMAVLIDADNTQLQKLADILTEVSAYGRIIVKKAYGNFKKPALAKWENVIKELAIKAEQQFDYVSGKNTTDIAMVIDAMDLLHIGLYDAFVLVSSDSDFTPLAVRLKESGIFVIGVGEKKTPTAFCNACDQFIYLEYLGEEGKVEKKKKKTPPKKEKEVKYEEPEEDPQMEELHSLLHIAYEKYQDDDDFVKVSSAGNYIKRVRPEFNPYQYGYSKLSDILKDYPERYEVRKEGKGSSVMSYKCLDRG